MSKNQLPHSLEAERALLGAILIDPPRRDDIGIVLRPRDFYDARHRTIFAGMLSFDGHPDYASLSAHLESTGQLKSAGGSAYLAGLIAGELSHVLADQYADQVRELSHRRRILAATAEIAAATKDGAPAAIANAKKLVEEIEFDMEAGQPVSDWQWRTLREAYEPKPPREYIVDGLLPRPSVSIFYGTPGTLKTMLAQDAAVCVANGCNWLEGLPDNPEVEGFPVTTSPVLWVDVDNGLDRLERRFAALGKARQVPDDAPLAWISFPQPAFVASDPESVERMIQAAQAISAKLVIFDNLGTISGGADENSSEMVEVMSGLRRIAEFGQCAVVVIHHSNKGDRARLGDRLRGHSSIEAAVDLALLVEREGESDVLTLQSTKTRDIPVQAFTALWTYAQDSHRELVEAKFYGAGAPDLGKLPPQRQAELCAIMDLEEGMNQQQLRDLITNRTDASDHVARVAIKRLVDSGKLRTEPGARNAILYYRAS